VRDLARRGVGWSCEELELKLELGVEFMFEYTVRWTFSCFSESLMVTMDALDEESMVSSTSSSRR
jgi:hypothetical protein